ncbi:hypothetical protein [uncultured Novosphingobium sp.]|uniref:hypothetical protein n=1 Tax=uncultured Novosphingobium sp. TaxID=292277 RepID=UPI0025923DE9|nr:hypothetical protein [uncultured Novosphingobium sp.]
MAKLSIASAGETTAPDKMAASTTTPLMPQTGSGAMVANETVSALVTITGMVDIAGVWQGLFIDTVFPETTIAHGKNRVTFQRRLLSELAMRVLMIVWKDSEHVCDNAIDLAGVSRVGTDCAPINCHNLAKRMAADVDDLDRQEKKIQGIVKAAEAYGLVIREKFKNTRQQALRGTDRLHRLMLEIDGEVRPICAEIAASGPGGL